MCQPSVAAFTTKMAKTHDLQLSAAHAQAAKMAPAAALAANGAAILVILGPTASGKSDVALEIARRTGSEILSVDSMQVYRGMDIGTAKPTAAQRALTPHHLIDLVRANELFTVARFVALAESVIADAAARGRRLIVTGGTPLYYKALFEGLFEGPAADAAVRARLQLESSEALHTRLVTVDPPAAARIHRNDRMRLVRALEVFELTGKPISALQTEWAAARQRHAATWVGLNWQKEALNRRINARVRDMIARGWVEEVQTLLAEFGDLSPTAREATGYAQLIDHVRGRLSLDDAIEQTKIGTRQLARRQMKWFRRFPNLQWIEGDAELETTVQRIAAAWR